MEKLRQLLLQWNVAPIGIVALFCYFAYWTLSTLLAIPPCETEVGVAFIGALCTAFAGITAILYKMYNSMQTDRKKDEDE